MSRKSGGMFRDDAMLHQSAATNADRQRIDRWLWHARIVRTRDAAASLAGAGYVRINGVKIDAPGRFVRAGDVITVALDRSVRVLRVTGFVARRGPASAGPSLYEDLS
jgi:ribosome-associated heat shock protein Hsp15